MIVSTCWSFWQEISNFYFPLEKDRKAAPLKDFSYFWLEDNLQFYNYNNNIAKLNSNFNFNFSLSFELSLALLSNFPPTHPPNCVSSEGDQDWSKLNLKYIYIMENNCTQP